MSKTKRIISIVLCIAIVFTLCFSTLFISTHADHNCTGDGCVVCYQIHACLNNIQKTSFAAIIIILIMLAGLAVFYNKEAISLSNYFSTPVSLKVRLID